MKKITILIISIVAILGFQISAFADITIYTTDENSTENSIFSPGEPIYLYLTRTVTFNGLPPAWPAGDDEPVMNIVWTSPSSDTFYSAFTPYYNQDIWVPLSEINFFDQDSNPYAWGSIAESGVWNVVANYSMFPGSGTIDDTKFTSFSLVTPEPISALLLLFGGASLALRRRFNR